jgi:hypothetical protein
MKATNEKPPGLVRPKSIFAHSQHLILESSFFAYATAIVVGIIAIADMLPLSTVLGTGSLWLMPSGDLAQNLTGHLAYQTDGWHWPLLLAPNLAFPHGVSIAMTDSNPLISMVAKALAGIRGKSENLLGFWIAVCWLMQPVAAVYVLRGFGCRSWLASLVAAIFAASFPALLFRVNHVNLLGHFLLLLALGIAARALSTNTPPPPRHWLVIFGLLLVAILCHPYLFVFAAAVLAAPTLRAVLDRSLSAFSSVSCYLCSVIAPVGVYWLLSGTLGGGTRGFGFFSMNLLSPLWPQRSGLFGANLPIVDATGGQYEGYNYLGAGGLMLLAIALIIQIRRPSVNWSRWRALVVILILLALLALSTKVYIGNTLVLSLGVRPWDQIFGPIQSTGRAFWLVGYSLVLASIAIVSRHLSGGRLSVVLATAVVLQLIDTTPLRAAAKNYFSGHDEHPSSVAILPGTQWLTILPVCLRQPSEAAETADKLRLEAIRAGVWLRDMRTSRPQRWFNCEMALTDGAELPLMPREARVFLARPAVDLFRQAVLGDDTQCRALNGVILCTRDLPPYLGVPVALGPRLPVVEVPSVELVGPALSPLLAYGWRPDDAGLPWSQGPRATLLFRVTSPASKPLFLRLKLDGIARTARGVRPITVRVGLGPPVTSELQDLQSATLDLRIPPMSVTDGIMRIAIDIDHPVDPDKRGLQAPVTRAGVRLHSIELALPGTGGE